MTSITPLPSFAILHHLEGDDEASWPTPRAYGEVSEQVAAAEALGFRAVWFAEHHFSAAKGRLPSPLLFIVRAGGATRTIRLGPAVLLTPYAHPLRLAEEIAMADVLIGGRLDAGLGSGGGPDETAAFGADLADRHGALARTIALLRGAWAGEAVRHGEGGPAVSVTPRPLQPFGEMVWVAASSHEAAAVAGAAGAHLLLPSLKTIAQSAAHVATYRRALAGAGHDPAGRQIQVTLHAWIDADRDRALAEGLPVARRYAERYTTAGPVPPTPGEPLAETLRRVNFVVGDAADVRTAVRERQEHLGITQIAFQLRLGGMSQARTLRAMEDVSQAMRDA